MTISCQETGTRKHKKVYYVTKREKRSNYNKETNLLTGSRSMDKRSNLEGNMTNHFQRDGPVRNIKRIKKKMQEKCNRKREKSSKLERGKIMKVLVLMWLAMWKDLKVESKNQRENYSNSKKSLEDELSI